MTQDRTRRAVLKTGAATVATTVGVSTATAADDGPATPPNGILGYDLEPESIDYGAAVSGLASQYLTFGVPKSARSLADDMSNEFDAHQDAWLDFANWLLAEADATALESAEIAVDVSITRSRWPTRSETVPTVIRTEYDDGAGEWTHIEWVTEAADDPDYQIELRNKAAENAQDELQQFRHKCIGDSADSHQIPDDAYISELVGSYIWHVGFGPDTKSVLELLVGEINGR